MSGIAEILLNLGFSVSGSDQKRSEVVERLESRGATISIGHAAEHLPANASLLVYSSAVRMENPEVVEAQRRGLPVIRRAEVLAELMRLKFGVAVAGSHGKTTTTSMIAQVLELGGLDPTAIIGGQVKAFGSGSRLGKGDFLVAESDESDRSFLLLKPSIGVITNIDAEHLTAYASFAELEQSFAQFADSVPFYGLAVLCIDDPRVRALAGHYGRRKVTYGVSPDAQIRAVNVTPVHGGTRFEVWRGEEQLFTVTLKVPGRHLALNSLAAVAVGLELGVTPDVIRRSLEQFSGVGRRLEIAGRQGGAIVMTDYGHHPTEIRATLLAVRDSFPDVQRFHVVFQPHRYSRTRDCFAEFLDAFGDCDNLLITEIYAASEDPIDGITGESLCQAVRHPSRAFVPDLLTAEKLLVEEVRPGDLVLCLGAGSIGGLPERLLAAIPERS